MMAADVIAQRRAEIAASPELSALLARLTARAEPVLARMPLIPGTKALLSADGGICPADGAALEFDPWSPALHRCPRCGTSYSGERHDRAWAHWQHLWLAERAAHLATVAVMAERPDAAARADALLAHYGEHYLDYPNHDNVLGPARLFFSTYLESIWLCNYLAAAVLLREAGMLTDATANAVSAVADEAANLIGEFDEGLSNRQTWHNAALAAIAVWFEDAELTQGVIERESGMIAHLVRGFGADGLWYEGENYHLFALRGQLVALGWARLAGVDLLAEPKFADILHAALHAPTLTALPDFTFPARKDARFGVSLAQPMYLESWEIGLAQLGDRETPLSDWLTDVYASAPPKAQRFDSYLHEAAEPVPTAPRTRADLSWWTLLEARPTLPPSSASWTAATTLLPAQGLAILRDSHRYVSLESGVYGGGHGHPDRLHLTLHADGIHWLPDFGTGSYVARDLFWYRSTLAHNAPRVDGVSQAPGDAVCECFAETHGWAWVRGRYGHLTRTVVAGPQYILDIVESSGRDAHTLELPWHPAGQSTVVTNGTWTPDTIASEFVRDTERLTPVSPAEPWLIRSVADNAAGNAMSLHVHVLAPADLLRAKAPGTPGTMEPVTFYVVRGHGQNLRYITVLESGPTEPRVRAIRTAGDAIEIDTADGLHRHVANPVGWEITTPSGPIRLEGVQHQDKPFLAPLFRERFRPIEGMAAQIAEPPALDGSLEGFADSEPLTLDYEDQYRRGDEPYGDPDDFRAAAHLAWDDTMLYVGVDVTKAHLCYRPAGAEPLRLDNEADDIHSDGIQLYVRLSDDAPVYGFLIVPSTEDGHIRAHGVPGTLGEASMIQGAWQRTETGYGITVGVAIPDWSFERQGDRIRFDLLVNRMEPDRLRRAGQLVWSGGGGWIWLRGDRQHPSRFGVLTLV